VDAAVRRRAPALGGRLLLAAEFEGERLTAGLLAIAQGRRWRRWLEIPSLPAAWRAPDALWAAVRVAARRLHVWEIDAGSFCSRGAPLPPWPPEGGAVRERTEWLLDLANPGWTGAVSSNHRRNASKARKAGLEVVERGDAAVATAHTRLMAASMQRRDERGEAVPEIDAAETRAVGALLAAGVATCFQARRGDELLSSLLVLRAPAGAYYQSAGTAPEGMALGASSLVVLEAAERLRAAGVERFNLGGAGPESAGLLRFKQGFGAVAVPLRAARYAVAPAVLRRGWTAARLLVRDPRALARLVAGTPAAPTPAAPLPAPGD
jgi:hypothetical protein